MSAPEQVHNAAGNMAIMHTLKCWAEHFDAILERRKVAEVRSEEDRKFAAGDILQLVRTDHDGKPTIPWTTLRIEVTHVDRKAGPLELVGTRLEETTKAIPVAVLSLAPRGEVRKLDVQPTAP